MVDYLSIYKVEFQITLDGFKNKHDSTRYFKNNKSGTYDKIIYNITKIINTIPNAFVWIRINFDSETLQNIDKIIKDIESLDKAKCSIIFRKIWQIDVSTISKDDILNAISKFMEKGFYVDYFALPRIEPCFAEKVNQALINYDGNIFKCSTLDDFSDSNTVGKFGGNGVISFDQNKIAHKTITPVQNICKECKIYPACYGPCSENVKKYGNYCTLQKLGLTLEELIMYNFKLNMLQQSRIAKTKEI